MSTVHRQLHIFISIYYYLARKKKEYVKMHIALKIGNEREKKIEQLWFEILHIDCSKLEDDWDSSK